MNELIYLYFNAVPDSCQMVFLGLCTLFSIPTAVIIYIFWYADTLNKIKSGALVSRLFFYVPLLSIVILVSTSLIAFDRMVPDWIKYSKIVALNSTGWVYSQNIECLSRVEGAANSEELEGIIDQPEYCAALLSQRLIAIQMFKTDMWKNEGIFFAHEIRKLHEHLSHVSVTGR